MTTEESFNTPQEQRILNLFDAFGRMHIEEILAYFADDAVYHKVPLAQFRGRAEITGTLQEFFVEGLQVELEVSHMVSRDHLVLVERVTRVRKDGNERAIPIMAIFEMNTAGKIQAWRDYFDRGQAGLV